jgi:hypothetical protein
MVKGKKTQLWKARFSDQLKCTNSISVVKGELIFFALNEQKLAK